MGQHNLGQVYGVPFAAKVEQRDEALVEDEALFDIGIAGDGAAPKAKARNMRAFLWAALGKGCIRMRQDRAESEVIQETLFGFFYEKGGCVTAIGWKIW